MKQISIFTLAVVLAFRGNSHAAVIAIKGIADRPISNVLVPSSWTLRVPTQIEPYELLLSDNSPIHWRAFSVVSCQLADVANEPIEVLADVIVQSGLDLQVNLEIHYNSNDYIVTLVTQMFWKGAGQAYQNDVGALLSELPGAKAYFQDATLIVGHQATPLAFGIGPTLSWKVIPEPGSGMLALLAASAWITHRRRVGGREYQIRTITGG